jgi:photosystem II stability/assembly factor-like uncharacterized protein
MTFASADVGFAVLGGTVARTVDGARTWSTVLAGAGMRAVTIAPGGAVYVATAHGLLRSTDGGATFEERPLAGNFTAVSCASGGRCLMAAIGGALTRTDDGGETGDPVAAVTDIRATAWPDGDRAVGVGVRGTTVLSADGGQTFARTGADLAGRYAKLRATSGSLAVAAGRNGGFALTIDGGATWAEGSVSTTENLVDSSFASAAAGFALDAGGTLYRTDNGGASWRILDTGTTGRPLAVVAMDARRVLVGGPRGVRRSADGGEAFDATGPGALRDAAITQLDRAGGGVLAYGRAALFTSADGRAWRTVKRPHKHTVVDTADFVSPRSGWLLDDAGQVYATRDRGRHWRRIRAAGGAPVEGLSFASPTSGWLLLAGFPKPSDKGWLLRTDDSGRSFRPQLVSPEILGAQVAGSPTLVATGARSGISLSPGHREADDDYGGDGSTIITGPQALFATTTGGDAGKRSVLTLHAPRSVRRGHRATLTGRLTPVRGGESITLWRGTSPTTVTTGSKGGFSIRVKLRRRTRFVAQFAGDEQRSSAGTRVVTVRVQR